MCRNVCSSMPIYDSGTFHGRRCSILTVDVFIVQPRITYGIDHIFFDQIPYSGWACLRACIKSLVRTIEEKGSSTELGILDQLHCLIGLCTSDEGFGFSLGEVSRHLSMQ